MTPIDSDSDASYLPKAAEKEYSSFTEKFLSERFAKELLTT
jgi:hypothetical protein